MSGSCSICDVTYLFSCESCGKQVCEDCMEGTKCTDCLADEGEAANEDPDVA